MGQREGKRRAKGLTKFYEEGRGLCQLRKREEGKEGRSESEGIYQIFKMLSGWLRFLPQGSETTSSMIRQTFQIENDLSTRTQEIQNFSFSGSCVTSEDNHFTSE